MGCRFQETVYMWTCREGQQEGGGRLVEIELELLQRRVVPLAGQQLDSAMAKCKGTLFQHT